MREFLKRQRNIWILERFHEIIGIMYDYPLYLKKLTSGDKVENPFLDFLGMELEEIKKGYARFSMVIRPEFLQAAGTLQGGLSIALSSETAAHAVMTTLTPGENVATIELKNNFLSTASSGRITAEATVYKRGRRIIIVDSVVRNEKGKDISRGSATLLITEDS